MVWPGTTVSIHLKRESSAGSGSPVEAVTSGGASIRMSVALQIFQIGSETALKIYSLGFDKPQYVTAKQQNDAEYEESRRETEIWRSTFIAAPHGLFQVSVNSFDLNKTSRREDKMREAADSLK